jgi:hypothetical protein
VGASSASVKVVEAGDRVAEEGAASVPVVFSSRTFYSSSSESLRMMILPSLGGPRMSRLRSPKSLLANSSSREVSVIRHSSSEDEERSTIGAFSEDPPPQTPVSVGSMRRPSVGTSVAMVIQSLLAVES